MVFTITPTLVIAAILAVLVVVFLVKGIMLVQQSEAVVIERLGSYQRTLEPGINWVVPFIDQPRAITIRRYRESNGENVPYVAQETNIDRRETVLDFPGQNVVTKDNVTVTVNGALYFQILDPKLAVYEVENFIQAVEVLAKTSLRSEIGKMELDKLFESRDEVNNSLQATMDEVGDKWGVKVNRVEIQDISMPEEVEQAMRLQMAAERKRRATVTEANGEKEAAIARAEGEKRSAVLTAEGEKEAAILRAQGEKQAIEMVLQAGGEGTDVKTVIGYLLGLEYLKRLPDIAKDGDRVFVPYESSALIGALGSFLELSGSEGAAAFAAMGAGRAAARS
ncbi:MAG: stomatin-like protein [Ectothiorhodospiraceae bacterium]|jgi:regulator of protease activity HflC (stomatin/prohibitin superfamily)